MDSYTAESILQAAVATAGATFGLTVFAWTTKYDFTEWVHFFYGKIFFNYRILLVFRDDYRLDSIFKSLLFNR